MLLTEIYSSKITPRLYIRKMKKDMEIKGFTCLKGSYVLYLDRHVVAFASGWHGGGCTFIYRLVNGRYMGDWVDIDNSDARGIFADYVYVSEEKSEYFIKQADDARYK